MLFALYDNAHDRIDCLFIVYDTYSIHPLHSSENVTLHLLHIFTVSGNSRIS